MKDRVVSLTDVAASAPWTEAKLLELAEAAGSPFHHKAGIWVARESAVLRWIESDDDLAHEDITPIKARRRQPLAS